METSILISTKKTLGIAEDYTVFDDIIIMHINTVFSILSQVGVGPSDGFFIEDESAEWDDFIDDDDMLKFNLVKSYMYLKVRMLFDPPQIGYLIDAMERQIQELEVRLNIQREETEWVAPS